MSVLACHVWKYFRVSGRRYVQPKGSLVNVTADCKKTPFLTQRVPHNLALYSEPQFHYAVVTTSHSRVATPVERWKTCFKEVIDDLLPDVFFAFLSLYGHKFAFNYEAWNAFSRYVARHQDVFSVSELSHILYLFARYAFLTGRFFQLCTESHFYFMDSLLLQDTAKWIYAASVLFQRRRLLAECGYSTRSDINRIARQTLLPLYEEKLEQYLSARWHQSSDKQPCFESILLTLYGCYSMGIRVEEKLHKLHSDVFLNGWDKMLQALAPPASSPNSGRHVIFQLPPLHRPPTDDEESAFFPTTRQTLQFLTLTSLIDTVDHRLFKKVFDLLFALGHDTIEKIPADECLSSFNALLSPHPTHSTEKQSAFQVSALGLPSTAVESSEATDLPPPFVFPDKDFFGLIATLVAIKRNAKTSLDGGKLVTQLELKRFSYRMLNDVIPSGDPFTKSQLVQHVEKQKQKLRYRNSALVPPFDLKMRQDYEWSFLDCCTLLTLFYASTSSCWRQPVEDTLNADSVFCRVDELLSQCVHSIDHLLSAFLETTTWCSAISIKDEDDDEEDAQVSSRFNLLNPEHPNAAEIQRSLCFGLMVRFAALLYSIPSSSHTVSLQRKLLQNANINDGTLLDLLSLFLLLQFHNTSHEPLEKEVIPRLHRAIEQQLTCLPEPSTSSLARDHNTVCQELKRLVGKLCQH